MRLVRQVAEAVAAVEKRRAEESDDKPSEEQTDDSVKRAKRAIDLLTGLLGGVRQSQDMQTQFLFSFSNHLATPHLSISFKMPTSQTCFANENLVSVPQV